MSFKWGMSVLLMSPNFNLQIKMLKRKLSFEMRLLNTLQLGLWGHLLPRQQLPRHPHRLRHRPQPHSHVHRQVRETEVAKKRHGAKRLELKMIQKIWDIRQKNVQYGLINFSPDTH